MGVYRGGAGQSYDCVLMMNLAFVTRKCQKMPVLGKHRNLYCTFVYN